jgi:hypothetical protein
LNIDCAIKDIDKAIKALELCFRIFEFLHTKNFNPSLRPILCKKYRQYIMLDPDDFDLNKIYVIYFLDVNSASYEEVCYSLFDIVDLTKMRLYNKKMKEEFEKEYSRKM